MDIWDQVYLYAYWNNQINRRTNIAENAACPNRQAVFCWRNPGGEIAMSKNLRDYRSLILLPSGESKRNIQEPEIIDGKMNRAE